MKFKLLGTVAVVLLLVTGCFGGNKTPDDNGNDENNQNKPATTMIQCEMVGDNTAENPSFTSNYKVYFQNQKLSSAEVKSTIVFPESYADVIDHSYESYKSTYDNYDKIEGVTASINRDDFTFVVDVKYEIAEMEKNEGQINIHGTGLRLNENSTIDEVINIIEGFGFTCNR
jgi:hypothetical protein